MTEKELMLISILNCRRSDLYARSLKLNKEQQLKYDEWMERRKSGEPLQYIIGFTDFYGNRIFLDDRVLIPRPETEILVENVIAFTKKYPRKDLKILDLGTGSGNIPIALTKNIENCHVTAVDISREAILLALDNAKFNMVGDKIDFICQDMISSLKELQSKKNYFDIIISNPPYIKTSLIDSLPKDVKKEPRLALDGGIDGLHFYKSIIDLSRFLLSKNGSIFLEIGDGQKEAIEQMFKSHEEYKTVTFIDDYVKTPRIVKGRI